MLQPQLNNNALFFANCSQLTDEDEKEVDHVVIQQSLSPNYLLPISLFVLVVSLGTIMFACMMMKNAVKKKQQGDRMKQLHEERDRKRERERLLEEENAGFMAWCRF